MIDPTDAGERERMQHAASDLFVLATSLGGTVSGEHGLGLVKSGQLSHQWPAAAIALHEGIKRTFDPKGLFNPGKKVAR
jgi:FAD/FMN-containing dehydrogenase